MNAESHHDLCWLFRYPDAEPSMCNCASIREIEVLTPRERTAEILRLLALIQTTD